MTDDPLTPEERRRFEALPRETEPPAAVEDRVVAALLRDGMLRSPRRTWRVAAQVAAAAILLAGGFTLGRVVPERTSPSPRYMLLLYGASTRSPEERQARVAEYGTWARKEAAAGRLEGGEELPQARVVLGDASAAPPASQQPLGFFVIRAATLEAASAIAAECPHLRHGGTVTVSRIAGRE